jgi:hypothetical protein
MRMRVTSARNRVAVLIRPDEDGYVVVAVGGLPAPVSPALVAADDIADALDVARIMLSWAEAGVPVAHVLDNGVERKNIN